MLILMHSYTQTHAHRTDAPRITCVIVIAVIIMTSIIFLVYDWLYMSRVEDLATTADISSKIVKAFFPKFVRDRMFGVRAKNDDMSAITRLKNLVINAKAQKSSGINLDEAVAENFAMGTILFADVAGFTNWSSTKSPNHIFHFLENLYQEFDKATKESKVYKVETIGDCYMAVTGTCAYFLLHFFSFSLTYSYAC